MDFSSAPFSGADFSSVIVGAVVVGAVIFLGTLVAFWVWNTFRNLKWEQRCRSNQNVDSEAPRLSGSNSRAAKESLSSV